ncbi:hypothetical protein HanXRQr2_Chr05g0218751 [Helianthus annuus]|uniref:Uncharacterized protein n=1 Tax=Helianthus annuus TaxID=4232 RepID=A0A9K3J008_HELAN|nr:hypothetical protein HanXRQr2_Chr05g0218751 [Helianthus annuus]KAJ0923055.1 hypothetical protein HanPSC8_Chr05g0211171 [Helianthus annuus]
MSMNLNDLPEGTISGTCYEPIYCFQVMHTSIHTSIIRATQNPTTE